MGKFKLIEHTGEVGIEAEGSTLDEAFAQTALGMFSLMVDLGQIHQNEVRNVSAEAPDIESLLVSWLNELIYLFDVEGLLFSRVDIRSLTPIRLEAKCYGERYDPDRHQIHIGVKAATYHMLRVVHNGKSHVRVILDI